MSQAGTPYSMEYYCEPIQSVVSFQRRQATHQRTGNIGRYHHQTYRELHGQGDSGTDSREPLHAVFFGLQQFYV